jgi:LPS-assembly protein
MESSARNLLILRRLCAALLAACIAIRPALAGDTACWPAAGQDPRLQELLKADPDDPRINITSDTGELSRDGEASLRGNVRIQVGQRLLTADEAEIKAEERSASLKGAVEFLSPELHVTGSGGSFSDDGGDFQGAEFELPEKAVRGSAENVKLREQRYLDLSGVSYTACPRGNEDWRLRAGLISLDQKNNMGTGRNVRLDVKGIPVLYSPWITFPVGDQRKSGLLFPTIGSSGRTGTNIAVPWYWNIATNYDATFTGRWFSKRGFRLDPEFRYLTDRSAGQVNAEYLFRDEETHESRYYVEMHDRTMFNPRTRLLVDAGDVSDVDYFEDFGVGLEGTSIAFVNRSAELRHDTDHWRLSGRIQDYQVIDFTLPEDDRPYTMLPRLNADGRWRNLGYGLEAGLRSEASYFDRDLGPVGLRVDVEPGLEWRAGGRGAYLAATAAWRYTGYSLNELDDGQDDTPDRSLPILSLDSGLVLDRRVGSEDQRTVTLEPRLLYLYVPYRNQQDLPIFDTGTPDLNTIELFRTNRYVGADRQGDANQLSAGITSRLLNFADGRQYLSATLGQAFYFEDPKVRLPDEPVRDRSTSDLIAELELTAFKSWSAKAGYQWNPDRSESEQSGIQLQYAPATDRVVNAGYRFRRDLLEQVDVSAAWPITRQWRGFGRWVYSLNEEKTLDRFIGVEYASCCWAVRLITRRFVSSRTGDTDTSFGLQLELGGLSSVGVDNEAFLEDAIRGYSAIPTEPQS